jgi:regulation of enolase protein 1 (concanavalin A-like superfamily)
VALTPALPGWLKLTRRGSEFTGSTSTDGITWTPVGTATLALPASCLVGLTASSQGGPGSRTIVTFSNITGPIAPAP